MKTHWKHLPNGDWGVEVWGVDGDIKPGERFRATRQDGSTSIVAIKRVIESGHWRGQRWQVCEVQR